MKHPLGPRAWARRKPVGDAALARNLAGLIAAVLCNAGDGASRIDREPAGGATAKRRVDAWERQQVGEMPCRALRAGRRQTKREATIVGIGAAVEGTLRVSRKPWVDLANLRPIREAVQHRQDPRRRYCR